MTYEEFLKHNAELINNKDFDAVFKIATTPLRHFERLIEDLVDLGFTPGTICPEITELIDQLKVMLSSAKAMGAPYNGERLWWLLEGVGNYHLMPLVKYCFEHDKNYAIEKIEPKYAWYGEGDDWYICRRSKWDINNFKYYLDEENY